MPFTPLHAALGETSPVLDFALLTRACEQGVEESASLDWKQELPLTATEGPAKRSQQTELAKDIAAFANSGGGMVVYGIAEVSGPSSAAGSVVPVGRVTDAVTQAIRQVAGNLIYPPVVGLELISMAPTADPAGPDEDSEEGAVGGALVMLVPASTETPHLMHPKSGPDWFQAPYRNGPHTEFMTERQLASSYASREVGRRRRELDFEAAYGTLLSALPPVSDLRWVVVIAAPEFPLRDSTALRPMLAGDIINRAWDSPLAAQALGPAQMTAGENTRRGLRRFIRSGSRQIPPNTSATQRAYVEVHGDGTVAVAFTRDGLLPDGAAHQLTQIPVVDLETAAKDLLALLWESRRALGFIGDYMMRLTVHPPTEIFRRSDPTLGDGHLTPWDGHRVYGYRPVDGPLLTSLGVEQTVASWHAVVSDAVNQAGAGCSIDPVEVESHLR